MSEPRRPDPVGDPGAFHLVPVLSTKLSPARLPEVLVPRVRRGEPIPPVAKVSLVVAAAGYGKTVFVREWLDAVGEPHAWFSIDALDANPLSFWRHVLAAIATVVDIGPEPEAVLIDLGVGDLAFLHTLIHRIVATATPVVLVLDDVHLVDKPMVLDQLALLVDRTPPQFRVVLVSRSEPMLPLVRWKLAGQLLEIGEATLRFGADDTARLLAGYRCRALDADALATVVERSEGWVTGLQFAALARPHDVLEVLSGGWGGAGEQSQLAMYLLREVLGGLPAAERDAALAVSVFEEFDVQLAVGLMERVDAGELIRSLHRGHVFLGQVGRAGDSYRFHPLVRTLLRDELERSDRSRWLELHRAAARLLAGRRQIDAAFDQLMTIGDVDAALELVVRPALSLSDQGWGHQFGRWLDQLPRDLDTDSPDRMLDLAFASFLAGRVDDASRWLDRAAPRCRPDDPRLWSRRLAVAIGKGDVATVQLLAAGRPGHVGAPGTLESRADTVLGRAHLLLGDLDAARASIERGDESRHGDVMAGITVPALRARWTAAHGHLNEAERQAANALDCAEYLQSRHNPSVLEASIAMADVALCRGVTDAAAAAVEALVDIAEVVDFPYSRAHVATALLRLNALRSGWPATAGEFDDLCHQAGWHDGDPLSGLVAPLRVRALISAGRLTEAESAVAPIPEGPSRTLALAMMARASRHFDDVHRMLADRARLPRRAQVEALITIAQASQRRSAADVVREALRLAAPLGLAEPFLGWDPTFDHLVAEAPTELLVALPRRPASVSPVPDLPSHIEPLTPRELALLAMLPTHLSNAAMGQRLYVSVNTVKTNLRAIYRKLGTSSRGETVALAQRLGMLPADPLRG